MTEKVRGAAWRVRPAPIALYLLGLAVMLQAMLLQGGFVRSVGDSGDGLILLGTLEHWLRVLHGNPVGGDWRSIGFFWPERGTLALTDSYFTFAVPYCVFRLLGSGIFTAYTLTIAATGSAGFWGFYALSRRWSGAAPCFAALGGAIFAFGSLTLWLLVHAQTYTIMLAPSVGLLLLAAWRPERAWPRRAAFALGAGLLYGAILLSAPETAWFMGFVGGLWGLAWLALARPSWRVLRGFLLPAAGLLAGLAIMFVPVLALYMPDLRLHHARTFGDVVYYSPWPRDLINLPPLNLPWRAIEERLGAVIEHPDRPDVELALGFAPVMLVATVLGALLLGAAARASGRRDGWDRVAQAAVIGGLLCFALELKYAGTRPWQTVFSFVPGGAIIRTPLRSQIASLLLLCLALAHIGTRASLAASARLVPRPAGLLARPAQLLMLIGAIFLACLAEQASTGAIMRDNREVTSWLTKAAPPPFPCKVFYLLPMTGDRPTWYEHQSDAIMLSQKLGIPTMNGNSSWYPEGWTLRDPAAPGYAGHVREWASQHGLTDRVCGADPRAGRWLAGLPAG